MDAPTELVVDLFCAADVKHQTETQLLEWLKQKAIAEYEKMGFAVLAFEVESMQLESASEPDRSVKAFFHGQYGRVKANDGIKAKVKLQLVPLAPVATTTKEQAAEKTVTDSVMASKPLAKRKTKGTATISASAYQNLGFLEDAAKLLDAYSTTLSADVATIFQECFADGCSFEEEYHNDRGDTDIVIGKWEVDPKFGSIRNNTYTVKLSGPIGPPTSRAQETQRYNLQTDKLIIDTTMVLLDAPYGDHFRVESQWIIAATGDECNVEIKAKPMFSKSTMLESTITKRTLSGVKESSEQWMTQAKGKIGGGGGGTAAPASESKTTATAPKSFLVSLWQQNSTTFLIGTNVLVCIIAVIVLLIKK